MFSADLVSTSVHPDSGVRRSRLIVTRRHPTDGVYRVIGYLDQLSADCGGSPFYEFTYLGRVLSDPQFVPIVGFRDLSRRYRSAKLFPSFADRVMSAKRPDRPQYLEALDLDTDADAWEILTASGGHREGDPIELISLPEYEPASGATSVHFLAHGVSHRGQEVSDHITTLRPNHTLKLELDTSNSYNPRALRIVDDSLHVGFVPEPLLDYAHSVIAAGPYELTVIRANAAETHPHLRLLLRLVGRCESFVFDEREWLPAC